MQANSKLDTISGVLNAIQTVQLASIDAKLGPQLPGGGISGALTKAAQLARKTWDFLQVDRVLNVLTWIGVLHNAYMLSNGIAQTLFEAIGNALNLFGIEDADGNSLDVGQIVSKWTDGFFKSIFGVETVNGIKDAWKKFNRIYQAAANIINTLQSITFSILEAIETVGNYVAKIGNAARKFGTFAENAYNWMNPNMNFRDNRFFNALYKTEDAVESIAVVTSELVSVGEQSAELAKQTADFQKSVSDGVELLTQDEEQQKTQQRGATIPREAETRPET